MGHYVGVSSNMLNIMKRKTIKLSLDIIQQLPID